MHALLCLMACLALVIMPLRPASGGDDEPHTPYAANLKGTLGLTAVPSARMDPAGTIRAGTGTADPYIHSYLGFQLAAPLYVSLRQSAEVSGLGLNTSPDRLYPGLDLKLRLWEETRTRPAAALGLQALSGHKRMASEYLVLSKRYNDFDFTAGLGWGRLGQAGHFKNPLKILAGHFGKNRAVDGEDPNEPSDWFTGEEIGIFGGVEYFTPLKGLSLQFDWGSDRYRAEQRSTDFNAPDPWSAGISYKPVPWAHLGIGVRGGDKIMGRVSLQNNVKAWPDRVRDAPAMPPLRAFRTGLAVPGAMTVSAMRDGQTAYHTHVNGLHEANTHLTLDPFSSAPMQLGRMAVHMSNHAGPAVERLTVTPTVMGLRGPRIHLMRRDFEQALTHKQGSIQEIWQNTVFETRPGFDAHEKLSRPAETSQKLGHFYLTLDNQLSLSEEDSGVLYRTSLLAGYRLPQLFGFLDQGHAVRLNIKDNLDRLDSLRPRTVTPIREDIDDFTRDRVTLDQSWLAFTHSVRPDFHLSLLGGYIEEMYGGVGAEVLYRPFRSRLSVGADLWDVLKRDPDTSYHTGFTGYRVMTGHARIWYDVPHHDLTLKLQAGRYLAGDFGGTVALKKVFKNGARLEGFITITDQADYDVFGGRTHAHHGLRLSLPLGGFKAVPRGIHADIRAEPFGRNIGQGINNPVPLRDLTDPFSYPHMARHWPDILGAGL